MLFARPVGFMQADKSLLQKHKLKSSASIGIDLMGGDQSPHLLFDAVIQAAIYLGPEYSLHAFLSSEAADLLKDKEINNPAYSEIVFHISDEVIEMSDEPLSAIRHKKNSSIVQALRQLKKKQLDAFVSLGNTGALIAGSALILPLLPGVKRPALLATLPASIGRISLLDVGGSVSYKAEQLTRFALMGACFERVHFGIDVPNVGLLNVGAESKKGTSEHRLAYQMLSDLKDHKLNFIGNLEGFEIFQGKAHVVVTDGFTGNIVLKSAEGIASYMIDHLRKAKSEVASTFEARFSSDEHPGAILLGVEGVVVKCHGASSSTALFNGIKAASGYVKKGLISKLKSELQA